MSRFCFIIFIFIFIFSNFLYAKDWTGFSGCGKYSFKGIVRIEKSNNIILVINEGTVSEIRISTSNKGKMKIAPYFDFSSFGEIDIVKKMNGQIGVGEVTNIKRRFPDPLKAHDTELVFISAIPCSL